MGCAAVPSAAKGSICSWLTGEDAWQEIFHIHLHVIPRFVSDRFTIGADWYERDQPELDQAAATLRAGLRQLG